MAIASGIDDPVQLGLRDKMLQQKEMLDRTGLVKTEKDASRSYRWCNAMPPKNTEEG